MSKKAKLANLKEERTEDVAKYETKHRANVAASGSRPGSKSLAEAVGIVPTVKQQSMKLDFKPESKASGIVPAVQRQAMTLDSKSKSKASGIVPAVQQQAMTLDSKSKSKASGIVPAVQQQAMTLDSKSKSKASGIVPAVQQQAMTLDSISKSNASGIVPAVQQQAMTLDSKSKSKASGIVPAVQQQAMIIDSKSNLNTSGIVPAVEEQARNLDSISTSKASGIVREVERQSSLLDSQLQHTKRQRSKGPPPAPPPPPTNVDGLLAHPPLQRSISNMSRLKWTPKELQLERKKLKKPEEIVKEVDVERADFFDSHKNYKCMPLVDSRETLRMQTIKAEIKSISFDGVEQLTDAFLFSLYHCKLSLQTVRWISLTGCYNITDEGIYWISQAFPNLRSIQMSGCWKITEKCIYYLKKDRPTMKKLVLDGTNCGVLPVDVNTGCHKQQSVNSLDVTTRGCPLVSPMLSEIQSSSWSPGNFAVTYRKMVILTPENLPWSPLAVLTKDKDVSPKSGMTFKQDWTPFKDNNIKDVQSSAEKFNVFQISRQKGVIELVLSAGSIVLLPYYLHANMPPSPAAELANCVAAILSKYDDCSIVLLGMSDNTDKMDYQQTVNMMYENVTKYLKKWLNSTNWRMAAFNYQEQEALANGQRLIRKMKLLLEGDVLALTSAYVKAGSCVQLNSSDLKFLSDIVVADEHLFPWNRQPMMSNTALEYSCGLKKSPFPLTPLSNVQDVHKFEGLAERTYVSHMDKLMSYAALWGQALYYPELEISPVLTDFQFLADIIQKLLFTSAPKSCDIRCLGDNMPCWTHEDLMKAWSGATEEQGSLLLHLLDKLGCLLTFPLDPWSNMKNVSFVYVFYKDLPIKAPSRVEDYWPLKKPTCVVERNKFYFSCPGLPESFFPNLLRHMFKLGGPALVWRDGAIIQKGHLTVLVEKIHEYQGLPVIVMQVRGSAINEMKHSEDWTMLKLYTNIMDHLALKYNLPVAKTVPCVLCTANEDRYQTLTAKKPARFFHEHLIRAGESRDVKCKHCSETSNSAIQIGPAIDMIELVPHHDRGGAALPTSNLLSRCLMCENCAIDGIHCTVNLKHGVNNWNCGCEREGKLCNYCGMCQRCFLFIKKNVSVVEPVFEPPKSERYSQDQLAALDEISVTEIGSLLGFISANTEVTLKTSILTPNYCPSLLLTVVQEKEGFFSMTLIMTSPRRWTMNYDGKTGEVMENMKELLGKDDFRSCKNGDTIGVSLRYLKGSFTDMTLSLLLNGTQIYSSKHRAQEVSVTLCNGSTEGVFLQIETPGRLVKTEPLETARKKNSVFEPADMRTACTKLCPPNCPLNHHQVFMRSQVKSEKRADKNCGDAVMNLPCALEMKMCRMLESIEQVCFGGRGVSLTGSACLALPPKITLHTLKYPNLKLFDEVTFHHLCLTWNVLAMTLGRRGGGDPGDPTMLDRRSYKTWRMKQFVHIVDADGIPKKETEVMDSEMDFMLWMWHFLMSTYPEMLLPGTTSNLFADNFLTQENQHQVKEGLHSLIRMGFWKYFSSFDVNYIEQMFKSNNVNPGRQGFLTAKSDLVQGSLIMQEVLQDKLEQAGLTQIYSRFNKSLALYLCPAHADCMRMKESLPHLLPSLTDVYAEFVTFIDLSFNDICVIPEEFFICLPNLSDIKLANNFIAEIPANIENCQKLTSLLVMVNNLTDLPDTLANIKSLKTLEIGTNCFLKLPAVVTKLTGLTKLSFPFLMLTEMPEDIGKLDSLKYLHANGNCFTRLPASFSQLTQLQELQLSGKSWAKLNISQEHMSQAEFKNFIQRGMGRWLEAYGEDHNELFRMFDENSNGVLDIKEVGKLNAVIFNLFPRFGYKGKHTPDESTPHGFPVELLSCKKLKILDLQCQGFTLVPAEISELQNLIELNISHNPNLHSIPAEISRIVSLRKLELDDCPLLKTPPREIREKGFHSTFAYLQRLMSGAVLSKRTKLMLVGLGGAGKTSLVKALLSKESKAELTQGESITDGIDIQTWNVNHEKENITYNIWDFAGQTVYYNTHQFFLSPNRAVYLLLWNVRLGFEHAGLDFWLSSISVQAPNTPVFVVGSHVDQVNKSELPIEEMQQKHPQVVGFHFISSFTGEGIEDLKKNLFEVTLQQQYMGEHIPAVWLTFEKNIQGIKAKPDIVKYSVVEEIANKSGIFEPSEIYQAVQFLHDLGSVQHFSNEYLKSHVVINPQWIVDVMACVVSVKNDFIKNGRLLHDDLDNVWSEYPKNLRSWLLRLTEEFDLTFQLRDQPVNLVPCLLPEKKPQFKWPELEKGSDLHETKMVYSFDYLPAGLFNRAQVRLHSLSDSSLIWKKGSFLMKNVHVALLQHTRDSEMVVIAQGPRPENILFLVHEVFEGLIAESFNGVTYDFTMPCPECQRMMVKDQHMFAASTIRRALDMKAPFLQCIKYFHTISCASLQTLLPPDTHSDFDAHLVHCVQGLRDLHKDLAADIFLSYCGTDALLDSNSFILPGRVHGDLVNKGYKCWYRGAGEEQSTDEMAKALIDASVFLAFVSVNYAQDTDCVNIFKYARLTLRKVIVVVAIGAGFEWKQSKLGILLSDEVFINMTKQKFMYYDSKFEELLKTFGGKTHLVVDQNPKPAVFFSYTWVNSAQAVALGTRELPGALGYGDPRELKTYLDEQGIHCWIDVERIGMNGLFDDIAEGLLSAKLVIVCVSDEYASSQTCQIEFRYAANTLKLPIILVVVGTGDNWRALEVGLTSVQYPIVNFQEKTKNAKKKLVNLIKERLEDVDDVEMLKAQKDKANEGHKNLSYQELFELAQRKLLRQLSMYAENQDLDVYPRLFVVDFVKEDEDIPNTDEELDTGGDEKSDIGKEKILFVREKSNAKKLVSRNSSVMLPAYRRQKYCVYTLCEHEEGWHSVAEPIELERNFGVERLEELSPYLARMTTVMKYNKKLVLNCLSSDVGEAYIDWLEQSPDATLSDYQIVYHSVREMVQTMDTKLEMGNLSRCHLTNGKTIWLCDKHRDSMRVTCLSNDDKSTNLTKDTDDKITNWMLMELRTMDYDVINFKSVGNAPRPKTEMNKYGGTEKKKCVKVSKRRNDRPKKDKSVNGQEPVGIPDNVDGPEQGTNIETSTEGIVAETEASNAATGQTPSEPGIVPMHTSRQQSEDVLSMTSEISLRSAPSSATDPQRQRRPLPGQSQYKLPSHKQTSRACEIS